METERHPFIFYSPKAASVTPFYPDDSKNINEESAEQWILLQVFKKYTHICLVGSLI